MSSAEYSCKIFKPIFAYRQTVWTQIRAVWSGSTLFAEMTLKSHADDKADDNCCDWQFNLSRWLFSLIRTSLEDLLHTRDKKDQWRYPGNATIAKHNFSESPKEGEMRNKCMMTKQWRLNKHHICNHRRTKNNRLAPVSSDKIFFSYNLFNNPLK